MLSEPQVSEAHKDPPKFTGVLAWTLAIVLFYVVSVGPAARLAAWSGSVNALLGFMKVYKPVILLRNTPLRGSFDWWVDLWVKDLVPFNLSGGNVRWQSGGQGGPPTVS
jgi:hypothetical protein